MADFPGTVSVALGSIVEGDATIQTEVGRSTEIIMAWQDLRLDGALPVIAYEIGAVIPRGNEGDTRRLTIRLSVFATGNGSLAKVRAIASRLETILSYANFNSESVNATPINRPRWDADIGIDREGSRAVRQTDLTVELEVKI